MNMGERIKEERLKRNLSGSALAKKAQIAQPYLSQIERGQRAPSLDTLQAIAVALNVSTAYLLGEETKENRSSSLTDIAKQVFTLKGSNPEEVEEAMKGIISDSIIRKIVLMLMDLPEEEKHKAYSYVLDQQMLARFKKGHDIKKE